jgi:integrase
MGADPEKAGVRYRNPYQTRHTFATKHISQGVNLFWLAGQMGHKGPEMLFRNYGKYLAEYDGSTSVGEKAHKSLYLNSLCQFSISLYFRDTI